jgi:hypothetical protein
MIALALMVPGVARAGGGGDEVIGGMLLMPILLGVAAAMAGLAWLAGRVELGVAPALLITPVFWLGAYCGLPVAFVMFHRGGVAFGAAYLIVYALFCFVGYKAKERAQRAWSIGTTRRLMGTDEHAGMAKALMNLSRNVPWRSPAFVHGAHGALAVSLALIAPRIGADLGLSANDSVALAMPFVVAAGARIVSLVAAKRNAA